MNNYDHNFDCRDLYRPDPDAPRPRRLWPWLALPLVLTLAVWFAFGWFLGCGITR